MLTAGGAIEYLHFGSMRMNNTHSIVRREISEVTPWTETCGLIRPLIEAADLAAGEVHHLEITDAKLHYHARTDEFYYVLAGHGRMTLDDAEVELHEGVVVYVPRGTNIERGATSRCWSSASLAACSTTFMKWMRFSTCAR